VPTVSTVSATHRRVSVRLRFRRKPLQRLDGLCARVTQLKLGVNEMSPLRGVVEIALRGENGSGDRMRPFPLFSPVRS